MTTPVTIPDLNQNYPILAVTPTPYLADGTGTCPQCATPGVLLVFTATDPQWIHCCHCGLNCSLRRLLSGADPAHRRAMAAWHLYLLARFNFLQSSIPASLRVRYGFSYHPDAPNRVGYWNMFGGYVDLAVFHQRLRELDIDMVYRSEAPHRGEALLLPICTHYGLLAGFVVLPADGPEWLWWRRGYTDKPSHVYAKVRPSSTIITCPSVASLLDRGLEYALVGYNVTIRAAPVLTAPAGMRETISPTGPVVDCRTLGQFDSPMTRICPATRRVLLPTEPPEPPAEIMPRRRSHKEVSMH